MSIKNNTNIDIDTDIKEQIINLLDKLPNDKLEFVVQILVRLTSISDSISDSDSD